VKDLDLQKLFEIIEEVIDAGPAIREQAVAATKKETPKGVPYPRLSLTTDWGEPSALDGTVLKKFIDKLPEGLSPKIKSLETFLEGCKEDCIQGQNISQAIANISLLDALASLVFDYNARPAGDLFELFLAALTGQKQTGGGGKLQDVGESLSVKLIMRGADIVGSRRNLEQFAKSNKPLDYFVAVKDTDGQGGLKIDFYEFNIPKNISYEIVKGKGEGLKFKIEPDVYEEFKIATLNIGSRENLRAIAEQYLNTLDDKVTVIFETLGTLSNQLTEYFAENNQASAEAAKNSAGALKANVEKLA
jgi:hypothetical protein